MNQYGIVRQSLKYEGFIQSSLPKVENRNFSLLQMEKEMATHSSTLPWEIPWTEAPGGLQPMGSQRGGHNLATQQQQHGSKITLTQKSVSRPTVKATRWFLSKETSPAHTHDEGERSSFTSLESFLLVLQGQWPTSELIVPPPGLTLSYV